MQPLVFKSVYRDGFRKIATLFYRLSNVVRFNREHIRREILPGRFKEGIGWQQDKKCHRKTRYRTKPEVIMI